jgi:8-oxo-dGTP pyrophosphatase MutT (NUDIX family)
VTKTLQAGEFTAEDFRKRALAHRYSPEEDDYGDHVLNPGSRDFILNRDLHEAAVLIPVVDRDGGATVLLTQRTEHLRSHSGQVAFPGGRIDVEDGTAERAAIRETHEETGIGERHIEIVGRMPDYVTGSGYRINPVLGILDPGFDLAPNPDEVAHVFEVPLSFLMDPANHECQSRMWQGRERFFYSMDYDGYRVWGVTAGIVRSLYERLYA